MSMFDKFKKTAEKAGMQAASFAHNTGTKVAHETRGLAQGFSLPGEAEKAAKILATFLGECVSCHTVKLSQRGWKSQPIRAIQTQH